MSKEIDFDAPPRAVKISPLVHYRLVQMEDQLRGESRFIYADTIKTILDAYKKARPAQRRRRKEEK